MNKQEIQKVINHLTMLRKLDSGEKKALYDTAISALAQQLNNGWIPAIERLPELPKEWVNDGFNRISILVTTEYEDAPVIRWYDIEEKTFYDDFDSLASQDFGVEAWMYLPKPREVSE